MGKWAVLTEDGLYAPTGQIWIDTKREAIDMCSSMALDPSEKPKVTKIARGFYEYAPKDCDNPKNYRGDNYYIKHQDILSEGEMKEIVDTLLEKSKIVLREMYVE